MKKAISYILILFLLLPLTCIGESIDFHSMSDKALEELNRQIQAELFSRHAAGSGVPVPPGRYIVGEDIPEGRYQVIVEENVIAATIKVINDLEHDFGNTYWLGSMYGGTTANITLKIGQALDVNSKTVTLRIFTSLF